VSTGRIQTTDGSWWDLGDLIRIYAHDEISWSVTENNEYVESHHYVVRAVFHGGIIHGGTHDTYLRTHLDSMEDAKCEASRLNDGVKNIMRQIFTVVE
jgi:hypothetical protein